MSKATKASLKLIQETAPRLNEMEAALESSRESAEWCHVWLGYREYCDLLGNLSNLMASSLSDVAANLGVAAAIKDLHPAVQQALQTIIHVVSTAQGGVSVIGFANYMTGTMAALGTEVYDKLMSNCSYYKGKVTGSYELSVLHKEKPFYTMSYRLSGEMWLSFENRKPGDPAVYLKGRIKGKAENFSCDLNMAPFDLPHTIAPAWCRCPVPPIASRHYLLYLEGKAMDTKMELDLERVQSDFDLKSVGYYVLISTHTIVPEFDFLEFPLMDAEWFLTRVTKISDPRNENFKVPITAKDGRSTAEETFEREVYLPPTAQRKGVRVNMRMDVRACSPECPQ